MAASISDAVFARRLRSTNTSCRSPSPLAVFVVLATHLQTAAAAAPPRVAVFGGSGFIGSHVCRALAASGCEVQSISRNGADTVAQMNLLGQQEKSLARFDEPWLSQVEWSRADASVEGEATAILAKGTECIISCIGSGDLLRPNADGWVGRYKWSALSERMYDANFGPNAQIIAAAQAAGTANKFVYVGVASSAELGYGGSLPGIYTGKMDAANAAQEAFGDGFTYFGPHLVVDAKDARLKAFDSGFAKGLRSMNQAIGKVRSFGQDYAAETALTPPVLVDDVAAAIAAVAMGEVEVEASERYAGMSVPSEAEGVEVTTVWKHVDGTEAIRALAARARVAGAIK